MNNRQIGEALDGLFGDVRGHVLDLLRQYREHDNVGVLKQAVDTPHRARAQLRAWIADCDADNGEGAGKKFLEHCLATVGSIKTVDSIDKALEAIEAHTLVIVKHVADDGWTWAEVADALGVLVTSEVAPDFKYDRLPTPKDYTTVWGEPW